MKRCLWLLLALTCAACAGAPAPRTLPAEGASYDAIGTPLALEGPMDDGGYLDPKSLPAATIVDFWRPDCAPCRETSPALEAAARPLAGEGIALLFVGQLESEEDPAEARKVLRSWGVDAGFRIDRGATLGRSVGVTSLPTTVVLDRSGVVRWGVRGKVDAAVVVEAARVVAAAR